MFRFMKSAVAIGSALALFNFGSVASARQECVSQGDIDAAAKAHSDAVYALARKQADLDSYEYSNDYHLLENQYYFDKDQCHRFPPGATIDPRDVQDCEDRALETFQIGMSDQISALEDDVADAEADVAVAWGAYTDIVSRPLCPVE